MFSADLSWSDPNSESVGQRRQRKSSKDKEGSIRSSTSTAQIESRHGTTAQDGGLESWNWSQAEPGQASRTISQAGRTPYSISQSPRMPQANRPSLASLDPSQQLVRQTSISRTSRAPYMDVMDFNKHDPFEPPAVQTLCYSDATKNKALPGLPSITKHFRSTSREVRDGVDAVFRSSNNDSRQSNRPPFHRYDSVFSGFSGFSDGDRSQKRTMSLMSSPVPPTPEEPLHDGDPIPPSQWAWHLAQSPLRRRRSERHINRGPRPSPLPMPGAAAAMTVLQEQQPPEKQGEDEFADMALEQEIMDLELEPNESRESNESASSTLVSASSSSSPIGTFPSDRFEQFVQDLEDAGLENFLDRIREFDRKLETDPSATEEIDLEKQLWALTAMELHALDVFQRPTEYVYRRHCPLTEPKKILELDGSPAQVYQLSAMFPKARKYYLSTRPRSPFPLPSNTVTRRISRSKLLPLPYATSSMDFIRSSTLAAILPGAHLAAALDECYRVLSNDGVLELRVIDPSPNCTTMGHRMRDWTERNLSVNLDMSFRCTRPSLLVPQWLQQAGFKVQKVSSADPLSPTWESSSGARALNLPAASSGEKASLEEEIGSLVARELWRDAWGGFVGKCTGQKGAWWWNDESVLRECQKRGTAWSITTVFATKN